MEIDYDSTKNARNIAKRNLPFDLVAEFDFATALYQVDNRHDYGETRIRAQGMIGNRYEQETTP